MSFPSPAAVQTLESRRLLADTSLTTPLSLLADMNGDGKADQVSVMPAAGTAGVTITLGLGNGRGEFRISDRIVVGPTTALAVGVGDLDGDGAADVAIAGDNPLSLAPINGTFVLTAAGDGTGKFKRLPATTTAGRPLLISTFVPEVARARGVSLADVDGNGFGEVSVLGASRQNDGTTPAPPVVVVNWDPTLPTFAPVPPTVVAFNSLTYLNQLHAGDLDGDGRLDLVATHRTPLPPSLLTVVRYDLATVRFPSDHTAVVRQGVNPLNIIPPTVSPTVAAAETIGLGNLNGDAKPELIGRRDNVLRYASYNGTTQPLFGPVQTILAVNPPPIGLAHFRAGDVTGDGLDDILASARGMPVLAINTTQPGGAVTVRWSRVRIFSAFLAADDATETVLSAS